ncbi:MAG: HD domain-containing protein [Deltaproteobacteria bacterium]|nr:HD domain-containing protein [Deltaproteobacteria bacterium]
MPGIRKSLLQLIFSGSSMRRWNDKLRPIPLVEVDKQAHKMIVAWVLFQLNSRGMTDDQKLNLGREIVEGGIFEYLYRLVITDIKPPIFYQIRANPAHYAQLTDWVLEQLQPRLQPLGQGFWSRMTEYVQNPDEGTTLGRRILAAAHMFASRWEFHLIRDLNNQDEEMEDIENNFREGLSRHLDLSGMDELMRAPDSPLGRFAHLCGQLRFQQRWSQTPRIPETSVLGHMFIVACFAYFFTMTIKGCRARLQNNFFAGLFHDVPELLTRDIISPVKRSVQRIGDLIKEYENRELKRRIFTLLTEGGYELLVERLEYYLGVACGSEFSDTICVDGKGGEVNPAQLDQDYNQDRFDPKDGRLLKVCDNLAAFLEAYNASRNGISNDDLQQAQWKIRSLYQHTELGNGLHIGALLADFD